MKILTVTRWQAFALRAATLIAVCGFATFLLGKDSNWDIFNYHLYVAHAFWINQDLRTDFMAAGLQRYLNPLGYLPFYLMIQAGWHSLAIALVLAAFHSLALVTLWEICARHVFRKDSHAGLLASLSVVLAATSPVFLGTLGGTYLDPVTLVFVLVGILLLCVKIERETPSVALCILAGGLFGVAAALKLTNLVFIATAGIALIVAAGFSKKNLRSVAGFGTGAMLGALLAGGWWSLHLYREFGNPFFPLFNNFFQSPDFASVSLSLVRFKPSTIMDALTFPLDMVSSHKWIYVENAAADIRFSLLIVFALLVPARKLIWQISSTVDERPVISRSAKFIIIFFVLTFAMWLATSGNGRYAMPILLLVAPILVLTIRALAPTKAWLVGLLFAILAAQGVVVSLGENPRWDTGSWTEKWVDVETPPLLINNPYGYLSVGVNSNAFLALNFHSDSRIVSMLGVYPMALANPGGGRVKKFITEHVGKLRSLESLKSSSYRELLEKDRFGNYLRELDVKFALWDLRTDPTDCVPIKFSVTPNEDALVISCALVPGSGLLADLQPGWERTSYVFNKIEKACPLLFSPSGTFTTRRGVVWQRLYINTDIMLKEFNGRILYSQFTFGPFDVDMGSIEEWERGTATWVCAKPPRHWK